MKYCANDTKVTLRTCLIQDLHVAIHGNTCSDFGNMSPDWKLKTLLNFIEYQPPSTCSKKNLLQETDKKY